MSSLIYKRSRLEVINGKLLLSRVNKKLPNHLLAVELIVVFSIKLMSIPKL